VPFKSEFDSIFQVGAFITNATVSPLSLWERVRVRGSFQERPNNRANPTLIGVCCGSLKRSSKRALFARE